MSYFCWDVELTLVHCTVSEPNIAGLMVLAAAGKEQDWVEGKVYCIYAFVTAGN